MRARWLAPLLVIAGCSTPATVDVDEPPPPARGEAPALFVTSPSDGAGSALVVNPPRRARATDPQVFEDPFAERRARAESRRAFADPATKQAPKQTQRPVGWVASPDADPGPVRFRPAGYDVVKTRCGGVAVGRYEVDWSSPAGDRWIRGGTAIEKDAFRVKPAPRLPPRPKAPSPPRVDERGQPTGSVIPLR